MTSFHDAVRLGQLKEVKYWLENGADINSTDAVGNTPLLLAVLRQDRAMVRYLLTQNPKLFKANNVKQIPITAARGKDKDIIRMLVIQHATNEHYAQINPADSLEIMVNKLITTLLYKSKRYGWDDRSCINLRYYIVSLNPSFKGKDEKHYETYIRREETAHHDFFGSWLSDDSDSEDEREFHDQPEEEREALCFEAMIYQNRAQRNKLFYRKRTKGHERGDLKIISESSRVFDLGERMQIHHPPTVNMDVVERDLARLNYLVGKGISIEEAQKRVPTQFRIAQYRGVTYMTSKWNKPARESHRKADERGQPQYSASVYKAAGIDIFKDYAQGKLQLEHPKIRKKVNFIANTLRELLLTFREPRPCAWRGYSYSTYAYLLQNLYTQAYDKFHQFISQDPMLSRVLLNDANPFLSTGSIPYHGDKYAYGIKPYNGHKDERLRPRWKRDGRAERPYSGVVYVSLHPLTDFDFDGPLHIPTLTWNAEIRLSNELNIIPEKESCFPSFMPEQRVIHKHVAKYPSFAGPYKHIYLTKYGLDEVFYNKLQTMLRHAAPHTKEMVAFKQILGEWLCGFHEVRLIEIARKKAEEEGCILIYKGIGTTFSLTPPIDSPHCNTIANTEAVKAPIKQMELFRKAKAQGTDNTIIPLINERDYENLLGRLDRLLLSCTCEESSVEREDNEALSLPMAFALNALKHQRFFALNYMLRNPFFLQCFNNNRVHYVNTYRLQRASLAHLAVMTEDIKALQLLLSCKGLKIQACDESVNEQFHGVHYYENISPLALAIICNQKRIIHFLLRTRQFDMNEEVYRVTNKDLLYERIESSDEDDEDHLGTGWCSREAYPIWRERGFSLVHLAIEHSTPNVVVMLLIAGAPPKISDDKHQDALDRAMRRYNYWLFNTPPRSAQSSSIHSASSDFVMERRP